MQKWCKQYEFKEEKPKVHCRHVLVGDVLTANGTANNGLANARAAHALRGAVMISRTQASAKAKRYALKALAIPRLLPSTVWTRPASNALYKLRTFMTDTMMGKHRRIRCAEVVMAILGDPIRDDPWGAMIANTLLATRRILRKDEDRLRKYLKYIADMLESQRLPDKPADGPMYGTLRAIGDLGVQGRINVDDMEFMLSQDGGPTTDLFHRSKETVKNAVRVWARTTILGKLATQCSRTDPRRKDMAGLHKHINVTATRSLLNTKSSPIQCVTVRHYR